MTTVSPAATGGFIDPVDKRQAVVPQIRNTLARGKGALIVRPFYYQARVQLEIIEATEGAVTGQSISGGTDEYKGLPAAYRRPDQWVRTRFHE